MTTHSPSSDGAPTRGILLVLPDRLFATALAHAIEEACPQVVVGFDWDALQDGLVTHEPAVVVTDVAIDATLLVGHLGQLVGSHPRTHFVVTTPSPPLSLVVHLLVTGVAAVVPRYLEAKEFGGALANLCRNGLWPAHIGWSQAALTTGRTPLRPIPARAGQVLTLLFAGWRHPEIAKELGVSVKSVERYVAEIRRAYGVPARLPGPWEQGHRGRPKGQ